MSRVPFHRIGQRDHGHAGNSAKRSQILKRLGRAAIRTDIEPGMTRHDLGVAACMASERRACSIARRQNPANVVITGSMPTAARPPAAAIMFCSAMPNG